MSNEGLKDPQVQMTTGVPVTVNKNRSENVTALMIAFSSAQVMKFKGVQQYY